jgi:hypothetical protein
MLPRSHWSLADTDTIRAGLRGTVATLPAGFKLSTILVGGQGVTATVREWGRLALLRYGKSSAAEVIQANYDADPSLRYLSYWTDAGAVSARACGARCLRSQLIRTDRYKSVDVVSALWGRRTTMKRRMRAQAWNKR